MARRNLLAEAQAQAAATVAPQVYALQEALAQARSDRNSAIRAASTVYKGVSGSIHRAGPQVRRNFSEAQASAAGTDAITKGPIAGNATIAAAAAHEGQVAGHVLSRRLADRLSALSDRRIAARAGQAFQVGKAAADYSAASSKISSQRSALASQQGLLTASNLSKLTEAQASRDFTANQNALQRQFQSQQSAADHAFTAHQDALGRRSDRINAGLSARGDAAKLAQQEKFTASQNAQDRQLRRDLAKGSGGGGPKPTANQVYGGREKITALQNLYNRVANGTVKPEKGVTLQSMADVHKYAQSKGYPEAVILSASQLATNKYVTPDLERQLSNLGITVPKEWTGVQVRSHTRRRRSK